MTELHAEIARDVTELQAEITAALAVLEGVDESDPQYPAAFERLVGAGNALLSYEAQVPARLEQPHLEVSTKSFAAALWAHVACAVLLGVAAGVGWIGGGWTVLTLAQLIETSLFYTAGKKPLPGTHRNLRVAAAALGAVTVLVPLLAFGLLPWWMWLVPLAGWVSAYRLAGESSPTDQRKAKA
ncbi:hypothetical protein [Streptomyces sp. NPDC088557]|uniref:hypothetical protein n=1 Tax=Streptomyces sp. NPDC088557 TaxID=3365867 RepID=UPI003821C261